MAAQEKFGWKFALRGYLSSAWLDAQSFEYQRSNRMFLWAQCMAIPSYTPSNYGFYILKCGQPVTITGANRDKINQWVIGWQTHKDRVCNEWSKSFWYASSSQGWYVHSIKETLDHPGGKVSKGDSNTECWKPAVGDKVVYKTKENTVYPAEIQPSETVRVKIASRNLQISKYFEWSPCPGLSPNKDSYCCPSHRDGSSSLLFCFPSSALGCCIGSGRPLLGPKSNKVCALNMILIN